jgi:hypothetical protein
MFSRLSSREIQTSIDHPHICCESSGFLTAHTLAVVLKNSMSTHMARLGIKKDNADTYGSVRNQEVNVRCSLVFLLGAQRRTRVPYDCGEKSCSITMIPASAFVLRNRWPSSLWLQVVSKW